MAELANGTDNKSKEKEYATDEAGMMADAKLYARKDVSTVLRVFDMLKKVENPSEEIICKTLIKVKYEQINAKRNERPSYEKHFD